MSLPLRILLGLAPQLVLIGAVVVGAVTAYHGRVGSGLFVGCVVVVLVAVVGFVFVQQEFSFGWPAGMLLLAGLVAAVFAPSGRVPAVLAIDAEAGAMVLEEILPGTEAEDLPGATLPRQWGELLAALHGVAVPAHWPWDLRGRLDEAFGRIGQRLTEPAIGARIDQTTWQRAIRRCETLLDTQTRLVLLHGDLHLGNVLDGGPSRGLVAIDPKACIGDPCFDAVDYVVAGAGHEGVEARCQRVATACGLDGDRLYSWSQVIAPVFAIAHLTHGGREPVIDDLLAVAS
ncbi:phosphotransferase [Lentzea rhizosphaerae]|uniref:Phosphotransferase n=1 Tax=Lentzea rhizosphaerae TaxID=2041025 RepID=A0ABV8C7D7_9PSEU